MRFGMEAVLVARNLREGNNFFRDIDGELVFPCQRPFFTRIVSPFGTVRMQHPSSGKGLSFRFNAL